MVHETHKILDPTIKVTATTVRVPVFSCHSEALNLEFEKPLSVERALELLSKAPGVKLVDDLEKSLYPLSIDFTDSHETGVGRIRKDDTIDHGLNMWIVSDNLLKGAALNAVQIAAELLKYL
jgi:aspartate-semialdehyde dehydrogenase